MVDFFFVLSGFVISLNYQRRILVFGDLLNFQLRRFLRLYPLHFLMLAVFLGVEIARYYAEATYGLVASNPAFTVNNIESFLHNLLLTQNIFLSR